ncbi:hypothetical protein FGG08_002551 [Glutinoglossum americanum]|uniref:Cytochrome P450 n=1 Tax=Glutinoglossum americanum TaxID=1670608 RepID=A0A9P8I4I0_9PEZI|nr:hypothetical protein FGG08_002551 [Glutinoglossum americanum]
MLNILILSSLIVLALLIYHHIIYPVFLSPLSRIPNAHPLAPITPLWCLSIRYRACENITLYEAHKKLGPVVRIGPNEVSVACQEGGVKVIYGKGWEKPQWHEVFMNFGVPNLFSTRWSGPHAIRKRRISNIFSKSYLHASADFFVAARTILYERYLPLLAGLASRSEPVDIVELNYSSMMDIASAYLLGLPNSSNFLQDVPTRRRWLSGYRGRIPHFFWLFYLPNFTAWVEKWTGITLVPKFVGEATSYIEDWCMAMCRKAEAAVGEAKAAGKELKAGDNPVVWRQIRTAWEQERRKEGKEMTPEMLQQCRLEVASEMLDDLGICPPSYPIDFPFKTNHNIRSPSLTVAAHETSGITMTYTLWELSRNPDLQNRLHAELQTLEPSSAFHKATPSIAPPKTTDSLPLLDAVLMETLRRHSALQGPLHRVTPPDATLGPYTGLPANVIVHSNAYTLHRNPDVFPDPDKWSPERWFEEDTEAGRKERWFWAFGSGGRMCVGSHLAILSMKHILSAIYRNYTTRVVNDEGIEQEDGFIVGPKSGKLILAFEAREK